MNVRRSHYFPALTGRPQVREMKAVPFSLLISQRAGAALRSAYQSRTGPVLKRNKKSFSAKEIGSRLGRAGPARRNANSNPGCRFEKR